MMINLSKLDYNSLPGKIARLPLRLVPKQAVVRILQGPLRGKKWIAGSSIHGCWLGTYELDKQKHFSQHLSAGDVVYDLGGHVGFYTLLAATNVGETGRVIVFEPDPKNAKTIQRHVELNEMKNVDIKQLAVSSQSGSVSFAPGEHSSTGKISDSGNTEIQAVALDELYANKKIPKPTCIKMDIEGAELRALHGAEEILKHAKPSIFLATHGEEIKNECISFLENLGYTIKPLGHSSGEDEFFANCS